MSDDSRPELGRRGSLIVLAAFGLLAALIATAFIVLGVRTLTATPLDAVLWLALGVGTAGVAVYHWLAVWRGRIPRWFTQVIHNS